MFYFKCETLFKSSIVSSSCSLMLSLRLIQEEYINNMGYVVTHIIYILSRFILWNEDNIY